MLTKWTVLAKSFLFFILVLSEALAQENLPALIRKIQPSVVTVTVYDNSGDQISQGSGFFVSGTGDLVTNHHVVKGASRIEVRTSDGKFYSVKKVVAIQKTADLVRLSVSIPRSAVKPIVVSRRLPEVGQRVVVIGSPLGFDQTVSDGIVSAVRDVPGFGKIIQLTAPISSGSSGSPVVNMKGEVIGVATLASIEGQNINFAIPGDRVIALSTEHKLEKELRELRAEREKLETERKRSEEERRKAEYKRRRADEERRSPENAKSAVSIWAIAEKPIWKVGYRWKYVVKTPTGSGTIIQEVVREDSFEGTPCYVVRQGKNEIFYTKDTLTILVVMSEGEIVKRRNYSHLNSWPMRVGEEWRYTYVDNRIQEDSYRSVDYRRVASKFEEVVVPAGSFESLKVESFGFKSGKLLMEHWYSPDAKQIVRAKRYRQDRVAEMELISFTTGEWEVKVGNYRVRYPTMVFSEPREDSSTVVEKNEGTRVNVIDIQGDWLEIRSKHGRPPGFIKKDSVIPIEGR